jgi:hypothetical protein
MGSCPHLEAQQPLDNGLLFTKLRGEGGVDLSLPRQPRYNIRLIDGHQGTYNLYLHRGNRNLEEGHESSFQVALGIHTG